MKRKLLTILMLILIITNIYSQNIDLPTVTIGFSGPLEGDLSRFGLSEIEAINDAIEKLKDKLTIELIQLDDQCIPEKAKVNAKELVDRKVDFVIGHVTSDATTAALPIYSENQIICVTPSATSPLINNEGQYENFFRTIPSDYQQSIKILEFAIKKDKKNILVIYEMNKYASTLATGIKENSNGLNINYMALDTKEKEFYQEKNNSEEVSSYITKTDLIIYCGYYIDFIEVYKLFRDIIQFQNEFIGCDGVYDKGLFAQADIEYNDVYLITSDNYLNSKMETLQNEYYNNHGNEPGPFYKRTYATTLMLLEIFLNNNELFKLNMKDKYKKLNFILRNENFDTLLGLVRFDVNGDILDNTFNYYRIENNDFKLSNF